MSHQESPYRLWKVDLGYGRRSIRDVRQLIVALMSVKDICRTVCRAAFEQAAAGNGRCSSPSIRHKDTVGRFRVERQAKTSGNRWQATATVLSHIKVQKIHPREQGRHCIRTSDSHGSSRRHTLQVVAKKRTSDILMFVYLQVLLDPTHI